SIAPPATGVSAFVTTPLAAANGSFPRRAAMTSTVKRLRLGSALFRERPLVDAVGLVLVAAEQPHQAEQREVVLEHPSHLDVAHVAGAPRDANRFDHSEHDRGGERAVLELLADTHEGDARRARRREPQPP